MKGTELQPNHSQLMAVAQLRAREQQQQQQVLGPCPAAAVGTVGSAWEGQGLLLPALLLLMGGRREESPMLVLLLLKRRMGPLGPLPQLLPRVRML